MAEGNLNARKVVTAAPGEYGDGGGLYLRVSTSESRTWVFRYSLNGRRREMGLGIVAEGVTLAEARKRRDEARRLVRDGVDPIDARKTERATAGLRTFGEVANAFIEDKGAGWKNDKHRAQWSMTLTKYAAPLRPKPVDEISTEDVLGVLKPIWLTKPETAARLRGRIEQVLDAAKARGLRTGENPAAWKGNLAHLLAKRPAASKGHHAAMPYDALPAFMARLRERTDIF